MGSNGDWSALRRLAFAGKFGVVPVGVTGAIADIGAPFELWIVPVGAAAAAVLAWLAFFYFPMLRRKVAGAISQLEPNSGACSEPFILSAFSLALVLACLTGLAVAWLSFSQREQGGFLGGNIAMVQEFQRLTGIIELQGETLRGIEKSASRTAYVLETGEASDPRVTLNNLGVEWSIDKFRQAVKQGDDRVVALFLRGGMPPENAFPYTSDFIGFLKNPKPRVAAILGKESFELAPAICGPDSWDSGYKTQGTLKLPESRNFYARVCNNEATKAALTQNLANYRRYERDDAEWNESARANKKDCLRLLNSEEGIQAAVNLGIPPDYDGNRTIDHPLERMAAKLAPVVMFPGASAKGIEAKIPEFARASCDEAFTSRPSNDYQAALIEDYEAVLELMN